MPGRVFSVELCVLSLHVWQIVPGGKRISIVNFIWLISDNVICWKQDLKSPSKKDIARREKQRLRDLKKRKRDDLEKFLEQQNAIVDADMVKSSALTVPSDHDDLILFIF